MAEFELIDLIRARAAHGRDDVLLGIGDDAAVLHVPAGRELVVAMDTLNAGVHFPAGTAPADIGWKALAVNLSDLAAMGAEPAWCTLSLSLPEGDAAWVAAFLDGFMALAAEHRVALVGGDTTRGPLSISVTVHGFVAPGAALRRDGARVGDGVWVSGTLGDAAAALAQWRARGAIDRIDAALRARLDRPLPRIALGRALAGLAHACLDVSDGLLADLGHVCAASGVGAEIDVDTLPASAALQAALAGDALRALQAGGGDDYELCFTAPASVDSAIEAAGRAADVAVTRIGTTVEPHGVRAHRAGQPWLVPRSGHVHFGD
ncbi:thiamine-phosphate kinase [Luteimonas sp. MC1825]|uniref:thiamine-phosphate kinase n=1 Tax=Luteimonas sp. MC1825 TaxID=2761107 RepID=UPI00160B6DA4|nr:thiamine-phosphate kinase [Luteimonas sp. MC1825]MBB6600036.1 thiamine-phosphate kinase [Luteimonas sp. MC1825]QOC87738.1 thiamine-phosphate kinase [Luteimonas sp. MC1825]